MFPVPQFRDSDIAKSLLIAVSNDIGQIAYLNARLHGLTKIYFGGYFIRGHAMTMHTITYAINYWSKVWMPHALFLSPSSVLLQTIPWRYSHNEHNLKTYHPTQFK